MNQEQKQRSINELGNRKKQQVIRAQEFAVIFIFSSNRSPQDKWITLLLFFLIIFNLYQFHHFFHALLNIATWSNNLPKCIIKQKQPEYYIKHFHQQFGDSILDKICYHMINQLKPNQTALQFHLKLYIYIYILKLTYNTFFIVKYLCLPTIFLNTLKLDFLNSYFIFKKLYNTIRL